VTGFTPRARRLLRIGSAAFALAFAAPSPAADFDLLSANTIEVTGDVRLTLANGPKSWLRGGFGKIDTSGDGNDFRLEPRLGEANLVWTPQLGWALSGVVVGTINGGERTQAGVSQAYLAYRPMRSQGLAFSARAGLLWPPVSLEHEGLDWHVANSITPSAINSWIGEEVRPVALEGNLDASLGKQRIRATAAIMAANDTAGTLLTFRGWAFNDRKTLAFNRQPLPPLGPDFQGYQAPYTHPLIDLHKGFAHRPGYYAKLAWQLSIPVRIELFRYDNNANPEDFNADLEWGWRTWFNNVGLVADLGGGTQLKGQALDGRTRMGFSQNGGRWVDNRFRSAFALLTHRFGQIGLAARVEAFNTRNRGSIIGQEYNEAGWSEMLAAKREWERFTGLVELLHVSSRRDQLEEAGLKPRQRQTQIQADLRFRW
jgi:hypothetical protein